MLLLQYDYHDILTRICLSSIRIYFSHAKELFFVFPPTPIFDLRPTETDSRPDYRADRVLEFNLFYVSNLYGEQSVIPVHPPGSGFYIYI